MHTNVNINPFNCLFTFAPLALYGTASRGDMESGARVLGTGAKVLGNKSREGVRQPLPRQ